MLNLYVICTQLTHAVTTAVPDLMQVPWCLFPPLIPQLKRPETDAPLLQKLYCTFFSPDLEAKSRAALDALCSRKAMAAQPPLAQAPAVPIIRSLPAQDAPAPAAEQRLAATTDRASAAQATLGSTEPVPARQPSAPQPTAAKATPQPDALAAAAVTASAAVPEGASTEASEEECGDSPPPAAGAGGGASDGRRNRKRSAHDYLPYALEHAIKGAFERATGQRDLDSMFLLLDEEEVLELVRQPLKRMRSALQAQARMALDAMAEQVDADAAAAEADQKAEEADAAVVRQLEEQLAQKLQEAARRKAERDERSKKFAACQAKLVADRAKLEAACTAAQA